jgi:hypothetical protein
VSTRHCRTKHIWGKSWAAGEAVIESLTCGASCLAVCWRGTRCFEKGTGDAMETKISLFSCRKFSLKTSQSSCTLKEYCGDCSVRGSSGGLSQGWNPIVNSRQGIYFGLSAGAA